MKNQGIKYGLISGGIASILSLAVYFIDYSLFASLWLLALFLVIGIVIAVLAVRKEKSNQGNLLSFKDAFVTSFTCLVTAGLLGTIAGILLFNVIDPDLKVKVADRIMENTYTMMVKFNAPADAIDETMEEMAHLADDYSAKGQTMGFLKNLIFYAVIALIIGAIMKSKSDELRMSDKAL